MKEWVVLQDAKDEGREEGREEEARRVISAMIKKGKTVEEIVNFCEYPYDLVKAIEEDFQAVSK